MEENERIKTLELEVAEMNNYIVSKIFEYLKSKTELYEYFNNNEKNIKDMYEFICKKAEKQSYDRVAMVEDKVVYLWAVMYFIKSNEELGIKRQQKHSKETSTSQLEETKKEITKNDNNQISMFEESDK